MAIDSWDLSKVCCPGDRTVLEGTAGREVLGELLLAQVALILALEFLLGHL